jgi:hypothetical protein
MLRRTHVVVAVTFAYGVSVAHADTRGTVRLGVMPLDLVSSSETPLFGEDIDRVVDKYNAAAAAYDRMSGGTTPRLAAEDVGVSETLVVFSPGLELGTGPYFFRLEVPIGFADGMKSYGVAAYPLNLQVAVSRKAVLYVSGGGSASWLDRDGSGDVGGLLSARAAGGLRFAQHFMFEVGYNAFVLGGSINNERLANMEAGMVDTLEPDQVISAGEARGIIDASLGVAF